MSKLPTKKISSVALAITKIEGRWSGKKIHGTVPKIIKISASDFKKIFETIRRELPTAYTSLGDFDAKEEYLTRVYRRYEKTAEVEYHSDLDGWGEFEVVPPGFYVCEDKFYDGMKIEIPIIAYSNRRKIFIEGSSLRQIGNENGVIEILWLVAVLAQKIWTRL